MPRHGWNWAQPRPQRRCWCGSGRKEKNCHGKLTAAGSASPAPAVAHLRGMTKKPEVTVSPWGVPGEEHKIIMAPVFKGTAGPSEADIRGERGKYRVQFLLARPGYPTRREREHKFIDNVVGTSHIRIVKPEAERGLNDPVSILLQVLGKNYQIAGIADKDGFLGKLSCELEATTTRRPKLRRMGPLRHFSAPGR